MKELEEAKIDQLLGIVNPYPSTEIAHFSDACSLLNEKIHRYCQSHGYRYQLNCTTDSSYEEAVATLPKDDTVRIKRFDLRRPRYTIQAKSYDYLFVTTDVPSEEQSAFVQKCHGIIKNAGLILIFVPRGDREQRERWNALLLEHYFVASNTLDLFEHYDVIISKKMHGWGG
jgi:hypothetical protein